MDLSIYASDLLKQHGELKVPGLGHFTHIRKNSHYNPHNGTLYPPFYEIHFNPHLSEVEDNTLVAHITRKKNISLASAKYFLEKYVQKLKQRVETEDVDFADLGYFYIDDHGKLSFEPNPVKMNHGASLFGYPPVKIQKLNDAGHQLHVPAAEPVHTRREKQAEAAAPILDRKAADAAAGENTIDNFTERTEHTGVSGVQNYETAQEDLQPADTFSDSLGFKNHLKYWVGVTVIVLVLIGAIFGFYKYKAVGVPQNQPAKAPAAAVVTAAPPVAAKPDTAKTAAGAPPTTAPVPAADSVKSAPETQTAAQPQTVTVAATPAETASTASVPKNTWIIVGGTYANLDKARHTIAKYHSLGFAQAHFLDSLPRKEYFMYKVIFGYRYTKKDADAARKVLLKNRKLKPKYIYVQPYK